MSMLSSGMRGPIYKPISSAAVRFSFRTGAHGNEDSPTHLRKVRHSGLRLCQMHERSGIVDFIATNSCRQEFTKLLRPTPEGVT